MAQEQLAPLAARVKELEEELTRAASDRDAFRARAVEATASATALAGQLGAEQNAHQLTKGALDEALAAAETSQTEAVVWRGTVEELGSEASRAAEASWVKARCLKEKADASRDEALCWKEKAEACQVETRRWERKAKESEAEVTRAAEASSAVQTVLETEIGEHEALKRAALSAYEALDVKGVHDGYVLPDDDEEADAAVTKLMEGAEGLGTTLATLFEEEVVPPLPSADAGGPEP
ncbi:late embryogenesis abundant protein 76-like [Miscanthus floridulus]|uniref:late embryogenesis abundant protein 76-like n=1 Tax=Miscanthus floridulus TaxID=154761 RepID=UPI003457AC27